MKVTRRFALTGAAALGASAALPLPVPAKALGANLLPYGDFETSGSDGWYSHHIEIVDEAGKVNRYEAKPWRPTPVGMAGPS